MICVIGARRSPEKSASETAMSCRPAAIQPTKAVCSATVILPVFVLSRAVTSASSRNMNSWAQLLVMSAPPCRKIPRSSMMVRLSKSWKAEPLMSL